jgi:predicted metal-dependent phosphoesterase TrpH
MPVIDMHVHTTRYSACSFLEPDDLVAAARARGLDGVVITEHGVVWEEAELDELRGRHPGLLLLAGQEVRAWQRGRVAGDILLFGCRRRFPRGVAAAEVIAAAKSDGGVAVAAHPFRGELGLGEAIRWLSLDGLETLSGNCSPEENGRAGLMAESLGVACLGGSDAHRASEVGRFVTRFDGPVSSLEDLVRLVREGCCRPAGEGT